MPVRKEPLRTITGCEADEFECTSDKECRSVKDLCDLYKDCRDGSDERLYNCGFLSMAFCDITLKYNSSIMLKHVQSIRTDQNVYCHVFGKSVYIYSWS